MERYIDPRVIKQMEEHMGDEKSQMVYHFLRAYKVALTVSHRPNFNFIVNTNGSFLSRFFQKLTEEVLAASNGQVFTVMDTVAIFLKFLLRYEGINFQAFYLVMNLPYYLLPHIASIQVLDTLLNPLLPTTVVIDNSEETLNRYLTYTRLSSYFEDVAAKLYAGTSVEAAKQKMAYKPMFLGDISKVIASFGSGAVLDTQDMPLEDKYSVVEERRSIKTDIDLLLRHFHEMAKRRNVLFRMRSTLNVDQERQTGFEIEKTRFPEIFKKLKESKDFIKLVDYESIRDREIYPPHGSSPRKTKKVTSRSPTRSRDSKSPIKLLNQQTGESNETLADHLKRNSLKGTSS